MSLLQCEDLVAMVHGKGKGKGKGDKKKKNGNAKKGEKKKKGKKEQQKELRRQVRKNMSVGVIGLGVVGSGESIFSHFFPPPFNLHL